MPADSSKPFDVLNPTVPDEQIPNFMGYSKGYDADRSGGTLIGGIGDLFQNLVDVKDKFLRMQSTEEVTREVDQIRDARISGFTKPSDTGLPPPEVTSGMDRLSRAAVAHQAGRMSDIHYWAMLDTKAREYRSKYPGYRDHIDAEFSRLTGATPANKLIQELSELQNTRGKEDNFQRSFNIDAFKKGNYNRDLYTITNDGSVARKDGKPTQWSEFANHVGERESEDSTIQSARLKHSYNDDLNKADATLARQDAQREAWVNVKRVMESADMEKKIQEFKSLETNMRGKIHRTPEEEMQLKVMGDQMEGAINEAVRGVYFTNVDPKGRNYASRIPGKDIEEDMKTVSSFTSNMLSSVRRGDLNLLEYNASFLKQMASGDALKITTASDVARRTQAIRTVMGDAVAGYTISGDEAALTELKKLSLDTSSQKIRLGETTIKAAFDEASKAGVSPKNPKDAVYYNSLVKRSLQDLNNETLPIEVTRNVAKSLFSRENDGFLARINPEVKKDREGKPIDIPDQHKVFEMMTSERVTKRMQDIKGVDPQLWTDYIQWTKNSFGALYRQEAQDLQNIVVDRMFYNLGWDDKNHQFILEPRGTSAVPKNISSIGQIATVLEETVYQEPMARSAVATINSAIRGILPVLKAEGRDPNTDLAVLFKATGLNRDAAKRGENLSSSLFGWMTSKFDQFLGADDPSKTVPSDVPKFNVGKPNYRLPGDTSGRLPNPVTVEEENALPPGTRYLDRTTGRVVTK